MTAARRAQAGLVRGCCLLVVVAVVVVGLGAFVADRALAAPDLGPAPQGPDHGESETAIAITLGAQLALALVAQPHAVIALSEHDLTVLAGAHPPKDVTGLTARLRDGHVLLSGKRTFGPFTASPVAHVALGVDVSRSPPSVDSHIDQLDVGQLSIPGFIQGWFLGSLGSSIDLNRLFTGSPALQVVRANLECLAVVPDGLRVGVHRPGIAPDTTGCAS